MAFVLGNFSIDEVLYGVAESESNILYTLDQLSTASIEISAESTDITDKKGNVVRTVYTSKTGTFNATNAFLHPQIIAAQNGSEIIKAGSGTAAIVMPRIEVVEAGKTLNVADADAATIKVIGIYGDGANSDALTSDAVAALISDNVLTAPAGGEGLPIQYLVKYDRSKESGWKLVNDATKFPSTVKLSLFCSYVDPCEDDLKPCYVVIHKFMPDPSVTISLDRESQEMDYNGNIQINYCSTNKELYTIYFPGDEKVLTGAIA